MLESIGTQRPGDKLKVYALRNNQLKEFEITLKNASGNTDIVKKDKVEMLGATFKVVSNEEKMKLNINHGLKVMNLENGKLKSAGIREGFIIMYIDKEPVNSVKKLKDILIDKKGGTLIEGYYPNGQRAYYGLGL